MSGIEEAAVGSPPSPCLRNCCLDEERVCMGCFRTMEEICAWHDAPDSEKLAILSRCRQRYVVRYRRTLAHQKAQESGPGK